MTEMKGRHAQGQWLLAPKSSNCERWDSTSEPDFWPEGPGPVETSVLGRRIESKWMQHCGGTSKWCVRYSSRGKAQISFVLTQAPVPRSATGGCLLWPPPYRFFFSSLQWKHSESEKQHEWGTSWKLTSSSYFHSEFKTSIIIVDNVKLNTHLSYAQFYYQSAPKTLSSICKVTSLLISDPETQASGTKRRTNRTKSKTKGPEFWKPRFKKVSGTLGKYYRDSPSPEDPACLRCLHVACVTGCAVTQSSASLQSKNHSHFSSTLPVPRLILLRTHNLNALHPKSDRELCSR